MRDMRSRRVGKAFGDAAPHYDSHAAVQRKVAARLCDWVARHEQARANDPLRLLEIGCGTGALTAAVEAVLPGADILATDIAPEMLSIARGAVGADVRFAVMDGEAVDFGEDRFDLILSSLAFQWFADLAGAVRRLHALLRPGGSLMFATLADRSFVEWRAAHAQENLRAGTPAYPTISSLKEMLADYSDTALFDEEYHEDFGRATGLLSHLKGIGARVPVEGASPLSAAQLRRVMRHYDAAGGRCTYHIAYCCISKTR